jgi:hypothetical protein
MSRPHAPLRYHLLLAAVLSAVSVLLCSCAQAPPEKRVDSANAVVSRLEPPSVPTASPRRPTDPRPLSVTYPDVPFERAPYLTVDVSELDRSALLVVSLEASYTPEMVTERLLTPDGFRDIVGAYAVARVDPAGGRYRFDLDPKYVGAVYADLRSDRKFVGWRVSAMLVNALRLESAIGPKSRNSRSEPPAYLTANQLTKNGPVTLVTEMAGAKPEEWSMLKNPEFFAVPGLKGDFGTAGGFVWTIVPNAEVVDDLHFDHK